MSLPAVSERLACTCQCRFCLCEKPSSFICAYEGVGGEHALLVFKRPLQGRARTSAKLKLLPSTECEKSHLPSSSSYSHGLPLGWEAIS